MTERGEDTVHIVDAAEPADIALDEALPKIAGRTPWDLARARLRRDKITMTMMVIVAVAVVMAVVAPILRSLGVLKPNAINYEVLDSSGYPTGAWGGTTWQHPLGLVPGTGSDLLSRLVLGVTFSLTIAFLATCVAIIIGTFIGIISGYHGRFVDFWLSRLIDMVLSFPQTLMLLALSGTFIAIIAKVYSDPNQGNLSKGTYIVLVLGLFGWPGFARVIRGLVLSMREREFVESAKSLGAKSTRIYVKELLPNLWAPVLVYFTLIMPLNISAEAALSYLGVGIAPPTPTLGNILTDSVQYAQGDFAYFIYPALFIAILVLSFNLLGDGLRDALDPRADR
ncbi:MAG: ABC transporter permease [Nostocoides sp.]